MGNRQFLSARRAAVSLIFATALIPLLMIVGLSIDYGLYNEAHSQLDMAADASVLHAARVAAQLMQKGDANYLEKGTFAGQQWFTGQLGSVPQAHSSNFAPAIVLTSANNQITATINYHGVITANFGRLFPGTWPAYPNWNIIGNATAVVSIPSYVEVLMLLDNSSSMLIAAYPDGISTMDSLTPCSLQAANNGKQSFDPNYSWAFTRVNGTYITDPPASAYSTTPAPNSPVITNPDGTTTPTTMLPYGYGTFVYKSNTGAYASWQEIPPPATKIGQCDARFTGALEGIPCNYPGPGAIANIAPLTAKIPGQCTNGGGNAGSVIYQPGVPAQAINALPNMPQAPCAFACHTDAKNNDYYGLARANNVKLRFDVVQDAAGQVIQAINSSSSSAGQVAVGIYDFNAPLVSQNGNPPLSGFTNDYPGGTTEADYNLSGASSTLASLKTPITPDQADSDVPGALTQLAAIIKKTSGSGATKGNAKKNLFIVTDGMQDYYTSSAGGCPTNGVDQGNGTCRVQGPVDYLTYCKPIKDLGVKIYVLYTLYLPLPNPFYLDNDKKYAESTTEPLSIRAALQQCASDPTDFYEADESSEIQPALLAMLASALGSPDRLQN